MTTDGLPNFLIIGAMKCGTTSLYRYLQAHPQVFMPRVKELDFFSAELNWQRGWPWYERQFAAAHPEALALGEASTSYTKYPRYKGVPQRIAHYLPTIRLIYIVRDPLQRIRSHYQHNVALGEERRPIERALEENPAYIDFSRYAMQLEQYLEYFGREQILVITAESLKSKRTEVVQRVVTFLELDPSRLDSDLEEEFYRSKDRGTVIGTVAWGRRILKRLFPDRVAVWRGTHLPPVMKKALTTARGSRKTSASMILPEGMKAWIREELRDDVKRFEHYTGEDLSAWEIE